MSGVINALGIDPAEGDPSDTLAKISLDTRLLNANIAQCFRGYNGKNMGIGNMVFAIADRANKIGRGDLSELEAMLVSQATSLDAIYHAMALRAGSNMGNLKIHESYMRLALKAQAQCRTTIEALVEIKQPKSVTITKQANFADQQVVNNGVMNTGNSHAHAEKNKNSQNELLGDVHHDSLDSGAQTSPIGVDAAGETVGEVNRAEDTGGKIAEFPE